MRLLGLVVLLIALSNPTMADESVVTIRVEPVYQFQGEGPVRYTIRVPRHKDNFYICFGWTSVNLGERTSCQLLDGVYAPAVFYHEYPDLAPSTDYVAFAKVWRVPNYLAGSATQPFQILVTTDRR